MGTGQRLRTCPCGVKAATAGQLVCRGCLTPLALTVRPAASSAKSPSRKAEAGCAPAGLTVRDPVRSPAPPGLRLEFPSGAIVVPAGQTVALGRECPDAEILERFGNLSRRHATVCVDPDGTGWIQDEHSMNGTFLDGRRLSPGARARLKPGDSLRFAADVPVRVLRSVRR
ncbi:FHA domain-containing protein [Streptomyces sp. TP-A0356]|uniref:FHA domain-containing protein n=1 Tax=Streptomyces sp. TP-A0356 TaxID=1359208 RepID=UPI00131DD168|nr:FHA domain-containing protein [Streptomyces sp. TP-A0356]